MLPPVVGAERMPMFCTALQKWPQRCWASGRRRDPAGPTSAGPAVSQAHLATPRQLNLPTSQLFASNRPWPGTPLARLRKADPQSAALLQRSTPLSYGCRERGDVDWQAPSSALWRTVIPNSFEESCLRACNECAAACLQCATACLQEADPKPMAPFVALDLECADICQLAVASIARGGEHMQAICALCAQTYRSCATECGKHDMDHCKRCAAACEHCADACLAMAH